MKKILIIDDEDELRSGLQLLLQQRGYNALSAPDASEGIRLARAELPDLILCDIDMPGGPSGLKALVALRNHPLTSAIPLILMTGKTIFTMRDAMDLGADDFLRKPLAATDIIRAIEARLVKHAALKTAAERRLAQLRSNLTARLPEEITSSLTAITEQARALLSRSNPDDSSPERTAVDSIERRVRRLQRSFRNCLLITLMEAMQSDPVDLATLRAQSTSDAAGIITSAGKNRARNRHREADLVFQLEPVAVEIAPDLLGRQIEELVGNACGYSEPGTPITISSRREGNDMVIVVSDRGRGMSASETGSLDTHFQVHDENVSEPGLGLGLSVCQKIAEIHGGSMDIKSVAGKGTTISIRLPCLPNQATRPEAGSHRAG